MDANMSILVLSFDGYSDVWDLFFQAKKRYWSDCPYTTRLVSNYITYQNVDTICVGVETSWSDRVLKALEEIKEPYVLLLLEDYLFATDVNTKRVEQALEYVRNNKLDYLRVVNIPPTRNATDKNESFVPIFFNEEYGVNLQASIWKTDYLRESVLRFSGSPWDFEVGFLSEAISADNRPMPNCYACPSDLFDVKNGILKGKWFSSSVRYFIKQGFVFDWTKRGKLSFRDEFTYKFRVFLKNHLDFKTRKFLKRIMTYLGVKFVSKY